MGWTNPEKREFYRQHLGNVYTHYLPPSVKKEMVADTYRGITCPCCGETSHVGATRKQLANVLQEDNGFLCYFCFNTGDKLTDRDKVAAAIYKNKANIIGLIEDTGLVKSFHKELASYKDAVLPHWFDFVRVFDYEGSSKIMLSLPENGRLHTLSLRQWRTRLSSVCRQSEGTFTLASDASRGVKTPEHLARLQKIHPKGYIKELRPSKSLSVMNCGKVSHIGNFTIPHPDFLLDVAKTQRRIDESGKQACCCVICAHETSKKAPSIKKDLDLANHLWQYFAAKVANALGDNDISSVKVSSDHGDGTGINTTKDKLSFRCHNPDHPMITDTYSNRLNVKRTGYCKQCLKDAGFKNMAELEGGQ